MNLIPEFELGLIRNYETTNGTQKPTTYADFGPAIYNDRKGNQFATIASPTAFKNLLEETIIGTPGSLIDELDSLLPHLVAHKTSPDYVDEVVTSVELPHRMASSWFLGSKAKMKGIKDPFNKILKQKFQEVGVPAAVGYYCPNTLLHGYMFTAIEGLNTHVSKRGGMITGGIESRNVIKVRDAGVAFDPILVSASGVKSINGSKVEQSKLSKEALGNIIVSDSYVVKGSDVKLSLDINYLGIKKMPVDPALKELIVDLANLQAALLLRSKIDVRVNTMLRPCDGEVDKFNSDEMLEMVVSSCKKCIELGVVNPDIITSFDVNIK